MKDFFVSYTGNDRTWAEWVAWVLEEAGYTVVIQAWDFRPGGNFVLDMQRATIDAERTIAVLSALYLEKPFPQPEWAAAFAQDPTSNQRKLIPVRVEDCSPLGLLAQIVYVDVFDCEESEAQQRLLSAVTEGRMKPAERPRFPGKAVERLVPDHVLFPGATQSTQPSASTNVTSTSQLLPPSLSAYDAATWVGRDALVATLTQKLQTGCRILALTGITGIGKTALAERLVVAVYGDGIQFHRLNFDDRGQGRDFLSGALALLPKLGETVTTEDQKDPQTALKHLLQALRHNCFLVQIDSLEMVLQGDDQTGWNAFTDDLWVDFFQQLLAGEDCQSQLLLTSQALPEELEIVGSSYARWWHRQDLGGLTDAEQLQLFEKNGLKLDDSGTETLQRIGKLYQGHPLVIQVIVKDILEKPFNGNVQQYWQRYQAEFDEMERDRKGKGSSPRSLQLRVKQRVEQSLKRLPADACQILCRSSVYRRPVPEEFWLAMVGDLPEDKQWAALDVLKSHNLAEEELRTDGVLLLRQHNLVRSVARELLKTDEAVWKAAEHTAAKIWLNEYKAEPDASNLEQVQGSLEAFYHYCEVEDLESAKAVLIDQEILVQLDTWGYCREMLPLYQRLLGKVSAAVDVVCARRIGNAYLSLSNYPQAVKHYQQSLATAREVGDRRGEGKALGNLGHVYFALGNYSQAIEYHQQHLTNAREIGDQWGVGGALGGLGNVYHSLGNYSQAIEYHQQDLINAREIGDHRGEGSALESLGQAYKALGEYPQAIEHYQQSLVVTREIGDRWGTSIALGGLGNIYESLGNYSRAIEYYQQSLNIAREIGGRREEGSALLNWGATLLKLEQYLEAQQHLKKSLEIFKELGTRDCEAEALLRLGEFYYKVGQLDLAQEHCDHALAIATELGIPLVKECEALQALLIADKH